jgi:hypothetical protein
MTTTTDILKKRISGEQGVVFYYTALVLFFILALITMIYDVSQISEKKMRLQVAADSAALEMAVWQSRGLNLTQNLNNEIYELDETFAVMYGLAAGMTIIGEAFIAMGEIPYIGPIFEAIGQAIELAASIIAQFAYYTHKLLVNYFLKPLRFIYARGTNLMGYIGANNVAYANGAGRIVPKIPSNGTGSGITGKILKFLADKINGMTGQFVAVGIPTSPSAALSLPVSCDSDDDIPLNIKDPSTKAGKAFAAFVKILCINEYLEEYCEEGGGGSDDENGGDDTNLSLFWDDAPYLTDPDMLKIPPFI